MKIKRLTRTISVMLALVLMLQLVPPALIGDWDFIARAVETQTAQGYEFDFSEETMDSSVIEEPDTIIYEDKEDLEYPDTVLSEDTEKYFTLLQLNSVFSDLAEADADFLIQYTGITANEFLAMEENGLSLNESVKYCVFANAAEYSVTETAVLGMTEEEYQAILTQFTLYNACISPEIDPALDQKLRGYIFTGSTYEQVLNAYGTSMATGVTMDSLLNPAEDETWNSAFSQAETLQVQDFSYSMQVSASAVADYLIANNKPTSDLADIAARANTAKASLMAAPQGTGSGGHSAGDKVYPDTVAAPYLFIAGENEQVSLNTGALVLNTTDFVLPGVNGLDLVIGRIYNSQDSNLYTPTVEQGNTTEDAYFVTFIIELAEHDTETDTWIYGDPDVFTVRFPDEDSAETAKNAFEGSDVLARGGSKEIVELRSAVVVTLPVTSEFFYTAAEDNSYFRDLYGLGQGWRFSFSSIEIDGDRKILHCADGSSYEIDLSSSSATHLKDHTLEDKILENEITDFGSGNTKAHYTLTYADGKQEYFSSTGKLLRIQDRFGNAIIFEYETINEYPCIRITDTAGRIVTISGESTKNGHAILVTLPDGKTLRYGMTHLDRYEDSTALASYTDAVGNQTRYSYTAKYARFDVLSKSGCAEYNLYLNLTTITHPTNAQTQYTYEPAYRNLGENGLMTIYRVTSRVDIAGGKSYNALTYTYSENDCSGYPWEGNPEYLPFANDYTYSAAVEDSDGIVTTTTFSNKHTIAHITVKNGNELVQTTEYEYNSDRLPTSTTVTQYGNGGTLVTVETAEYDDRGNIKVFSPPVLEGNTAHATTYAYNAYHLLTETSYWTDPYTHVVVTNHPCADGKYIEWSEVTVNGVLAQQTTYTYDASGNVISIVKLNTGGTSVRTDYTYENGLLVREECSGVKTNYTYDNFGRLETSTDGNGNTTHYTYDAIGNVTSIIHPNGDTVTYTRDYAANAVTVTDENGNSIKYTYTPLGQEREVIDAATGYVITRKSYDSKQRLTRVEDYIYGSVTEYTYDAFGRVLSETVLQGSTILSKILYTYDDALNGLYNKVTKTIVGDISAPSIVTTQYTDKYGNIVMTGQVLGGAEHLDTYTFDYAGNVLSVLSAADAANGLQYTAKYEYNGLGQVVKTYNALGNYTTSTYDMLGRVVTTTDYAGTPTTYTYDALGRLTSQTITIETGVTAASEYEYDNAGNLIVEYKPVQEVGAAQVRAKTTYAYDSRNRLITVEQYDGTAVVSETTYAYDGVGNTLSMTVGGNTTAYTYDRFGNVLTMTDARGMVESYTYSVLGRLDAKTDRNGTVTTYGYDALGRVVETVTSLGDVLAYEYTLTGQLRSEQSNWQLTEYSYDELGRVITVTETELTQVQAPRPFTVTLDPNGGAMSESTTLTVWSSDAVALPVPTRTGYTFAGWYNGDTLVAETAAVCITEDCTLTAKWTANTYTIVFHGNGGRLASGDTVHMILCTYDEEFQLPANEFALDGWEFVCWQRKLAENGAVLGNFGDGQTVTNLTFEQGGEVHLYAAWEEKCAASYTLILDANGGAVSTDRMTVVVGETYDLPTPVRTGYSFAGWYLDDVKVSTGDTIELTGNATLTAKWVANRYAIVYDLNGGSLLPGQSLTRQVCTYGLSAKLSTVVPQKTGETFIGWGLSPDGPVVYAAGAIVKNLTAEHQATVTLYALWRSSGSTPVPDVPEFPDEGGTYSLRSAETTENSYVKTYEYDLAGNRTSFTLTKDGETVHNVVYQYDVLNRLVGLVQDGESVATYTYDSNGNRATLTYATGTVTTYSYNLANWVTGMTSATDGTTLTSYAYTYYADGNRKSEIDWVSNAVTTYVYDDLGRLVQESETDGLTISYTYDSAGNRIQMVVTGEENYTTTYVYDANNRLTQEVRAGEATLYTYDPNGNLLQKSTLGGAEFYEYNGFNQLVILKQGEGGAAYGYNASGIRVSKQVGDNYSYYLLDGGDVVAECEDGSLSAIYTRGFNLVYRLTMDGMEFYLHDAHGDVVALTDGFGALVKTYSYDAFGNEENPDDSDTNPFRYCGEYFDNETKTYYLRARYYDPAVGRFTQQDPIKDGMNWYTYCINNPISLVDPSGLSGIKTDGTYFITHPQDQRLLELKQEYETATPERRAQIALEAKAIRDSGIEGVDWSVRDDFPLERYIIDVDITFKLHALMAAVDIYVLSRIYSNEIDRCLFFAWMVQPGGIYDLKSQDGWNKKEHFIYMGNIVWYDAPGNILYGYLGKVMGFPDEVLLKAAGAVQIFTGSSDRSYWISNFDDPRDQVCVSYGIYWYKVTHSPIWR